VVKQPNKEFLETTMRDLEYNTQTEDRVQQRVNVFTSTSDDDWDYEAEMSTRTSDAPYIIHVDEFFGGEMGFDQTTLTYYQGDDILVDELNVPIYNYQSYVGEMKFGHGSKDRNVVYIRNEALTHEWEILLSQDCYADDALEQEIETQMESNDLKHSNSIPKFKKE
jgi:hypothetical protein